MIAAKRSLDRGSYPGDYLKHRGAMIGPLQAYEVAMQLQHDQPMTSLVRKLFHDVEDLIRSQVKLAKAEIREEAGRATTGTKLMAISAVLSLYCFAMLLLSIVRLLETRLDAWAAPLVVALALGIPAGLLFLSGRRRWKEVNFVPDKTVNTIKETLQ